MKGVKTNLLTVNELSEITGWKPKTIYNKKSLGQLEFVMLGRSLRFRADSLQKLIEDNTVPALEPR